MAFQILTGCFVNPDTDENQEYQNLVWETRLPAQTYYASPALSDDQSVVYTGTSLFNVPAGDTSQVFVALNTEDGKRRWTRPLGRNVLRSAPVVTPDGSILIVLELHSAETGLLTGEEIVCLTSSGQESWKYNINHGAAPVDVGMSTPAVAPDGTIYVAGDSLYALTPEGKLKWRTLGQTGEMMRSSPVIGYDGTVYFVSHNVPLTAFDPVSGSVKWSCTLGVNDHCLASPAIGTEGTLYAATNRGLLYAVSEDGQLKWVYDITTSGYSGYLRSSPAVDRDGNIYFGLKEGYPASVFFSINKNGALNWIFEPADLPTDVPPSHFDIYSSPAIGTGGIIFFGHEFGRVYALNAADGAEIGIYEVMNGITWPSPAIDDNGVLYISDLGGNVYALRTSGFGLDQAALWPKYRGNNLNSGKK